MRGFRRGRPSVLLQKRESCGGHSHELLPVFLYPADEPAIIRVFPNGKPRARRAPHVEHLLVGSVARLQPEEQVNDQSVYGCA